MISRLFFLENLKNVLVLEKKGLECVHVWVKFFTGYVVLIVS